MSSNPDTDVVPQVTQRCRFQNRQARNPGMSRSDWIWTAFTKAASLLCVALLASTQSASQKSPRHVGPSRLEQACWHPGLSRNIGIAEPGCDFVQNTNGR